MPRKQEVRSADTFDYVIVGTGAGGSIVASRLSEDPGVTVCSLEAAPPDTHPFIHIPAGLKSGKVVGRVVLDFMGEASS